MKKHLLFFSLCISVCSSSAQEWEEINPFPGGARDDGVAFSVHGFGIAGSGRDAGFNYRKDFYKYNPATDSWSQIPDIPGEPRQYAGRFVIADTGYVVCGVSPNSFLNEVWGYCPATNEWNQKASLPAEGRASPVAFSINGKGYCGTGRTETDLLKDFWEYNPEKDRWEQLDDFPGLARFEGFGIALEPYAYAGMGRVDNDQSIEDWWRFNPDDKSWSSDTPLNGENSAYGLEFAVNGKIYIACGLNKKANYLNVVHSYNPLSQSWNREEPLPSEGIKGCMGFTIDNALFLGTGITSSDVRQDRFFRKIIEPENSFQYKVYPNPTGQIANLVYLNDYPTGIRVFSVSGKLIEEIEINTENSTILNMSGLPTGLYLFEIQTRTSGTFIERIVKTSE